MSAGMVALEDVLTGLSGLTLPVCPIGTHAMLMTGLEANQVH
jgi:hypothetical protein